MCVSALFVLPSSASARCRWCISSTLAARTVRDSGALETFVGYNDSSGEVHRMRPVLGYCLRFAGYSLRFAGYASRFSSHRLLLIGIAAGLQATALGCATSSHLHSQPETAATPPVHVAGVWDGTLRQLVTEGMAAGDTREERQEWHLDQRGRTVSGYYLATLTFISGDGRPYLCSRQPQFSAVVRVDVRGNLNGHSLSLVELAQRTSDGPCALGDRPLVRYRAEVAGDQLTLTTPSERQILHRNRTGIEVTRAARPEPSAHPVSPQPSRALVEQPHLTPALQSQPPADVSGVWVWEHNGHIPTGDEKQEREEWHVDQDGDRISGYYDRVVREISTDGQAFRCSMNTEFEIATRYRIHGEVRGNQVVIYENGFEVLAPNACDNGQRRLDAYQGLASGDEVQLMWGVGAQVLHRAHPDVPTQRF
jgi:hypothetical protein